MLAVGLLSACKGGATAPDSGVDDADLGEDIDADVDRDEVDGDIGDVSDADIDGFDAGDGGGDGDVADGGNDGGLDGDVGDGGAETTYVRVTTDDDVFEGELVAVYDHSIWWHDPADVLTRAIFRRGGYDAAYPRDQSFVFISSLETSAIEELAFPEGLERQRQMCRREGFVLQRPPLDGVSYVITGHESYHLEEDGMGDYAYDFELTDEDGRRHANAGTRNEDFYVWEADVFLPTTGIVMDVVRDAPDHAPGGYEEGAVNNLVGFRLGGHYYLYLLHFQQDSIPEWLVTAAETYQVVEAGTFLGRVGNSGVSYEPHLHVVLLWYDADAAEPRSWSIPLEMASIHLSDSPLGPSVERDYAAPLGGTWVSAAPF